MNETGVRAGNIGAVVLAAGESRRMGRPKMLLPFRGTTIIEQVLKNIREAGIEKITVVIGAEKEKLSQMLQNTSVSLCINNNYREGMLSSVICGIMSLPENTEGILVFPGDQPLIAPATISKLVEHFKAGEGSILIPVYKGSRGHPLLFDAIYRPEIGKLSPAEGLRSLSAAHPGDVREIETDDPGILKDFDTCDDYLKETNQIS